LTESLYHDIVSYWNRSWREPWCIREPAYPICTIGMWGFTLFLFRIINNFAMVREETETNLAMWKFKWQQISDGVHDVLALACLKVLESRRNVRLKKMPFFSASSLIFANRCLRKNTCWWTIEYKLLLLL
jgi:hypothetical protein